MELVEGVRASLKIISYRYIYGNELILNRSERDADTSEN